MTTKQKQAVIDERKSRGFPWHGPPHPDTPGQFRIVTGTCYEHRKILNSRQRLEQFEEELLNALRDMKTSCAAWCILPNHYHVLVRIGEMHAFARSLGQLHGRVSLRLNDEDCQRGRKVWYRCQDRCMRSARHYYTSLNYIHNNPVKHGYVEKWQHWPFSSVHWYLENKGRAWLADLWREYPVLNYGATWDNF